jgi:alpha-ketoglutarate-dependent taurine dioxygenase
VRRHPQTGRKALYAPQAYFKRLEGGSDEDSRGLLEQLGGLPYRIQNTLIVWNNVSDHAEDLRS